MTAPSRYAGAAVRTWTSRGGTVVSYLAPRILPGELPVAGTTVVGAGEGHRIDLVAYRTLGDPLLAYRLADANDAMDLLGPSATPGERLRVPRQAP